jgi:hypothetical protein
MNVGIKADFNHIKTSRIIEAAGTVLAIIIIGEKSIYNSLLNEAITASETPVIIPKRNPEKILINENNIE